MIQLLCRSLFGIFALVALLSADPVYAKSTLLDAKLGVEPGLTRVLLTLSERAEYRLFALADPYRIVIDMNEVTSNLASGDKLLGQGHVAAMRYGLFKVGTSRIVLDLTRPVKIVQAIYLPGADGKSVRLLIDIADDEDAKFRAFVASTTHLRPPAQQVAQGPAITSPSKKRKRAKPLIVLDPGHGGVDPGAISGTLYEKNITLAVAKALKKELQATGRYEVKLTREKDIFIPLRERFKIAREADAQLFLSLHADSHSNARTRGASIYTLSEQSSDAEAGALAAKENKSDVIAGLDLSDKTPVVADILIDLAQRETNNLSVRFASYVVSQLGQDIPLLEKAQRSAGFAVLKAPDIPSALLEMGYLSSEKDQLLLRGKAHQIKLAQAIRRAIDAYFQWYKTNEPA